IAPERLASLVLLVADGTVSLQAAKRIFAELVGNDDAPRAVADRLGLVQVRDTGALEGWVAEVIAAHPGEVARYKGGDAKLIGFFVGQVMKRSQGKADPKGIQPILTAKLAE
ncbi:MAG: Asp-tRNA(Asn)/Glu-tRNA(Gln) amidotransferase GatCAB subunit B, partial [Gemmatimonadales bacterium]|nr:Asp-tRNA(Asn)/Glu-tRNA(Gln) amidotransferase GatCAB subunit B [Gemmatimonadales bacterium]